MNYPESSGKGDLILKKDAGSTVIECQRVIMQRIHECPKMKINSSVDVVTLLKELKDYDRERAIIMSLDTKNNVVSIENISTGSLNASIVHPREALKGSLLVNAAHILFIHNHPSGDPWPSVEDRAITKKLQEAFNIVGIDMLDSIIIGRETYYSFKEHGEMFPESKYKEPKSGGIMESNKEQLEEDACEVATAAAMSVISERCGAEGDEDVIESLERQAMRMIEKARDSRIDLERQLQYYKDNKDAVGILRLINYLKTWVEG